MVTGAWGACSLLSTVAWKIHDQLKFKKQKQVSHGGSPDWRWAEGQPSHRPGDGGGGGGGLAIDSGAHVVPRWLKAPAWCLRVKRATCADLLLQDMVNADEQIRQRTPQTPGPACRLEYFPKQPVCCYCADRGLKYSQLEPSLIV